MWFIFKSFETPANECWNKGLSTDAKESLDKSLYVTFQAIKLWWNCTPVRPMTFEVKPRNTCLFWFANQWNRFKRKIECKFYAIHTCLLVKVAFYGSSGLYILLQVFKTMRTQMIAITASAEPAILHRGMYFILSSRNICRHFP